MKKLFAIAALIALYGASLLWLTFGTSHVFTSPDENANFIFAKAVHAISDPRFYDAINVALHNIVHPRSVVAISEYLRPGSFLGWPIFSGLFAYVVGDAGIPLFTPLLLFVALAAWWDMTRRLCGFRFANIATMLLAVHPAVWYWTSRSMMHNIPFICFLIFAVWVAIARPLSRHVSESPSFRAALSFEWFTAGLLIGGALWIRTSEAPWVILLAIGSFIFCHKGFQVISWRISLFTFFIGLSLPIAGMLLMNAHDYGSPFVTGYTVHEKQDIPVSEGMSMVEVTNVTTLQMQRSVIWKHAVLPFGFHPRAILKNVWNFGLVLFPLMTIGTIAGMWMTLREKNRNVWRALLWVTIGLAVWLGIVYGSWSFNDNPDPSAITIGDSHVRYWLPLFVLSTLFVARAVEIMQKKTPFLLLIFIIFSATTVFGGDDGLIHTRSVLFASAAKRDEIIASTEKDAIIVVDRADKFLWPHRRVIQPLRSDTTYAALPVAVTLAPLYYYGIPFPESDMIYLNTVKLAELGLRIVFVKDIGDEALYRIEKL